MTNCAWPGRRSAWPGTVPHIALSLGYEKKKKSVTYVGSVSKENRRHRLRILVSLFIFLKILWFEKSLF